MSEVSAVDQTNGFYVPSYLDAMDVVPPELNWKGLADSFAQPGPLRFSPITDGHILAKENMDRVLRMDKGGVVFVQTDDNELPNAQIPIGAQIAILNYSDDPVVVKGIGEALVVGAEKNVIAKWRVGVLVKYNANFWLLSLGSGAGQSGPNVPDAPRLNSANAGTKSVTLAWSVPADDGGSPITGYATEYSKDEKAWTAGPRVASNVLTTTITGLGPGQTSFRVKASNADGESVPSNILTASPTFPAPTLTHGDASSKFTIQNYDSAATYTLSSTSGTATVAGNTVTTGRTDIVTLRANLGGGQSDPVYLQTAPVTGHNEQRREFATGCNCRTDVDPHTWDCGCVCGRCDCGDAGGGAYGDCTCGCGYINVWIDDGCPGGYNQWEHGNNGGDWWRTSTLPLAPMKKATRVTGMTLNEHGLFGMIRAPWRVWANDGWKTTADADVFTAQDDSGRIVTVLSTDWDVDDCGYSWDEERQEAWLYLHQADTSWAANVDGSLVWNFMAQTQGETLAEVSVHVDGEVAR